MTASLKQEQLDQLPKYLLEWDDSEPLGPMELTGAYYVRGHADGRSEGAAEGREQGLEQGLTRAIEGACELLGIALGPSEQAEMQALDAAGLDALYAKLRQDRRWPTPSP